MDIESFRIFTQRLKETLEADDRVLGMVMLGSAAEQSRLPDAWSDHDFFVITKPGHQETFRTWFEWLPDDERIVLTVRETPHGLKILYDNGHLLEYAIFDEDELHLAKVNDYRIWFDRANITATLENIAQSVSTGEGHHDYQSRFGQFLGVLFVGAGRCARGEILSGSQFIKSYALMNLIPVLVAYVPTADKSNLDNLDPFRRFEQVYPEIGAEIAAALLRQPVEAALHLLEIAEKHLKPVFPDYPVQAAETVRNYLTMIVMKEKS